MILEGLRVLDLTRVIAGPAATRTLADLGAQVLKVEPPDGDLMRRGVPKIGGVSVGYTQQNAGKHHLSIDLSQHAGQQLVRDLAMHCDVLVENYRPGVAARLGIGYDTLSKLNPALVYCSISGYGQTGPAAGRRAYAPIIHAELGLVDLNARERGTQPLPEAVSHADFAVGAQAATGILAALVNRNRTGRGDHVDVSMAETMLAVNEWTAVETNGGFGDGISPFRPGKAALLKLKDGSWVQVPGNPTTWIFGVARALDKSAELETRGWFGPKDTQGKDAEIKALMQQWADDFSNVAEFEAALEASRTPLGTVKPLSATPEEDWAHARHAFVEVDVHGELVTIPRSPFRFASENSTSESTLTPGPQQGAGRRGCDNRAVLSELLGLDDATLDQLEADGVLSAED
jgi:crotonobetainyl-CoA:carnitine CoA-transferase CaiB-like acyl-CoA transferase